MVANGWVVTGDVVVGAAVCGAVVVGVAVPQAVTTVAKITADARAIHEYFVFI